MPRRGRVEPGAAPRTARSSAAGDIDCVGMPSASPTASPRKAASASSALIARPRSSGASTGPRSARPVACSGQELPSGSLNRAYRTPPPTSFIAPTSTPRPPAPRAPSRGRRRPDAAPASSPAPPPSSRRGRSPARSSRPTPVASAAPPACPRWGGRRRPRRSRPARLEALGPIDVSDRYRHQLELHVHPAFLVFGGAVKPAGSGRR